jgi:hypothetical protein
MAPKEASKLSERLTKIIHRAAKRSVSELLKQFGVSDYRVAGAGLVVGSVADPTSIKNDHIRAHALEGQLFRTALEQALLSSGLSSMVVLERNVYSQAAAKLNRTEQEIRRFLTDMGKTLDGPWRADDKVSALAAWMFLASQR